MPFIKAVCTNCSGVLKVDESKRSAICPFCGTPYVAEPQAGFDEERYLENGIAQLKLKEYDDAYDTFRKMSKDYPKNWRAWYGMEVARFGKEPYKKPELSEQVRELVPQRILERIDDPRMAAVVEDCEKMAGLNEDIEGLNADIAKGRERIDALREFLNGADKRLIKNNKEMMFAVGGAVLLMIIFVISLFTDTWIISLVSLAGFIIEAMALTIDGMFGMWLHERRQAGKDAVHFADLIHQEEMDLANTGAKITKKTEKLERLKAEVRSGLEAKKCTDTPGYYTAILEMM